MDLVRKVLNCDYVSNKSWIHLHAPLKSLLSVCGGCSFGGWGVALVVCACVGGVVLCRCVCVRPVDLFT